MYIEEIIFVFMTLTLLNYFWFRSNPKSRLPKGPTGLPILGYLPFMGKVPCLTVTSLAKKYGKIFTLQLGQYPVVFVNDFETIKEMYKLDVLTGRAQLEMFKKRGYYGLGLLEGQDWIEVRRFMLRCLRDLGCMKKSMEGLILEEVSQFTQLLKEKAGKPLYLKPLIEIAVINALWGMLTSEKYNIEDPVKQKISHIMSEGIGSQNIVGLGAFVPWLAKLFPGISGYAKGMEYFGAPEALVKEILEKHISTYSPGNERDFIDLGLTKVYNTTDPKSQFYNERGLRNLHYTIIDLFFAGSDTLSSTLGWTFLYLAIWPNIQKKLHDEIDKVLGTEVPSMAYRPRMPYVEATMAEVMRKSSMVPFGLFHTPIEDFDYGGYTFPKGTYFLSNLHHIHNDPEYWGDPESFRPERFLTPDGKFQRDEHLIPFFTGRRTCPAENLAMIEYFLFLVGILQKYEFRLNPNDSVPDIGPRAGFILTPPKHELYVHLRL